MSNVPPPSDDGRQTETHFAVVPLSVLEDTRLSDAAARLYAVLDGRITSKGSQRLRQDTLAEQLGWSRSKVQRVTKELAGAGYIETRRTSRSSRIVMANPVRTGEPDTRQPGSDASNLTPQNVRCVKSDAADASNMTPPQINILLGIKTNNNNADDDAEPSRQSAPASAVDGHRTAEYVEAINEAAGVRLVATKTLQATIGAIKARGLTPADTAALVAAVMVMSGDGIHTPAAYIASRVLPDIAAGNEPQEAQPTHTPRSMAEINSGQPCEHGEPRGPDGCALCRNARHNVERNEATKVLAKNELFRALHDVIGGRAKAGNDDGETYAELLREHPEDADIFFAASLTGQRLGNLWLQLIIPAAHAERVRDWVQRSEVHPRPKLEVSPYGDWQEIQITYPTDHDGWFMEIPRIGELVDLWHVEADRALLRYECNDRLERSHLAQRIRADFSQWGLDTDSWCDDDGPWATIFIHHPEPDRWLLTDEDTRTAPPERAGVQVYFEGQDLDKVDHVLVDADDLDGASIRGAFQDWLTDNGIKGKWVRESSDYTHADTAALRCTFTPGQSAKILEHLPSLVDIWSSHCTKVYGSMVTA